MKKVVKKNSLFGDIKTLIEKSKRQLSVAVNSTMTMLYWQIGNRIKTDILQNKRAEYGKEVIKQLADNLTEQYGKGWGEKHLRHCLRFADIFPDVHIVSALRRQLTWTHIKTILYIEDDLKRAFYIELCKLERWSTRVLEERINSMLYERTAISKKPEETVKHDLELLKSEQKLTPDLVFRDPYFLDFLGLRDKYSEKDLENAIIVELQNFIIEFGSDFAFMDRQKRISVDSEDYYLDLLFYHRRLRSLVAIELKLGNFEAAYKGQMELYLRWLDKNMKLDGENSPIGLILCAGKSEEHIELLQLENSNIKVADYLTQLPDKKLLEQKFRAAIEIARQRLKAKDE
ncbi:MAG: PDDEXK nuclease domain-containing protein [Chitinispirillales bacterium]|jgi:predicted nuclease of restriction endonuclease-like (RecB) superfamily|nr:PDDEXK nuclease domain-containing protein [Chitinispirillales bacterium]